VPLNAADPPGASESASLQETPPPAPCWGKGTQRLAFPQLQDKLLSEYFLSQARGEKRK
jgi:hypothetical protein